MDELALDPVDDADALQRLVDTVFADPEVRRGMGWTEADDREAALEAISGLWHDRFEDGWDLRAVRRGDRTVGLVGLGPVGEDATAWYAVYLLDRGEGLGRRLTRWGLDEACDRGADRVLAVTWAENEASRGLLEAEGFELEGPAPFDWARESELSWVVYLRWVPTTNSHG